MSDNNLPDTLNPAELLQQLIRFDTTNPPGNEREIIQFIQQLLGNYQIESSLYALIPERPNLVAKIRGQGNARPLLLQGHVDVVTTANQSWQQPPFGGKIVDGYIWGRGALDMKGPLAMMLTAILKCKTLGLSLPGDVIFTALADEETGSNYGAKYLVEQHADLFQDVRYALGEFGGFNLSIFGKRFYPIMVGEKGGCWMLATFYGPGGHGSIPIRGGAMAKAARALVKLDRKHLPVHVSPVVRLMVTRLADAFPGVTGLALRQLANPILASVVLHWLQDYVQLISPLLRNTVSPTILKASDKINVIPSEIAIGLDGRLVPGGKPEQMIRELRSLLGQDFDLEILEADACPGEADLGLFEQLGSVLQELDPGGIPIPYVLPGVTDARFFSRLGIQTYGFTPLKLPETFEFVKTAHAANERVPVEALDFGVEAIYRVLQRFH